MIGPLGYLFALVSLILGVALYREQNRAIRVEKALRSRITALQNEIRRLRPQGFKFIGQVVRLSPGKSSKAATRPDEPSAR